MKTLKLGLLTIVLLMSTGLGTALVPQTKVHTAKLKDIECLARNIYHEARGEPLEGQVAVAQVTVNRVESGGFQSSVCNAVYANRQFSWTLDKSKKIKDRKAWEASITVAKAVLTKSIHLPDFKALYFHTKQVKPRWNRGKRIVAVIGNHIFYS